MISHESLFLGVLMAPNNVVQTQIEYNQEKELKLRCLAKYSNEKVKVLTNRFVNLFSTTVVFRTN